MTDDVVLSVCLGHQSPPSRKKGELVYPSEVPIPEPAVPLSDHRSRTEDSYTFTSSPIQTATSSSATLGSGPASHCKATHKEAPEEGEEEEEKTWPSGPDGAGSPSDLYRVRYALLKSFLHAHTHTHTESNPLFLWQ